MRLRLVALLAAVAVTPALAQMQIRPMPAPPLNVTVQQDTDAATQNMTVEEARAKIAELNRKNRDLDGRLTEALATIDQWTKKGGKLVHAYCESDEVSRNSAGAVENCAMSGYGCAPVEGTCRRSCTVSSECAGTHNCESGQCVPKDKYADHG